jgi:hypothetical protein
MRNNPLSSLHSPEQVRALDRRMFFANFFLRQVENDVKEILKKFQITFPIILDFNYPKEGSKYGIALVDSHTFANYNLIIHYNPRLITLDFN